ncbi:MAG: DUF4115 domain-containing protein [Candidatus Omnitrophica bacterium]|nr:DUF4115 domain-containing protein [Candidatus Omnitrophota bacterium]
MSSVGEQLRQAREQLKRSHSDVTKDTKIQPWVLEAIEEDRLPQLMSPIYVKGFLTSYARYLHLEPEPLLAGVTWPTPEPGIQQTLPPPAAVVTVSWRELWSVPLVRHVATAAALSAAVLLVVAAIRPARRWMARLPMPSIGAAKTASLTSGDRIPKLPELPTLTLLATQPLELHMTALRTTWITVRADGKLLAQQRLLRGAKEQWSARKELELIIAQPADVEVTLNGQSISPFALAHRGRLLITHRGVTQLRSDLR